MLNISNILSAVANQLWNTPEIQSQGYPKINIVEPLNTNPDLLPWIGLYPGNINYEPRTLGRHARNREATIIYRIVTQIAGYKSGEENFAELELKVKSVLDALLSDPTYDNAVEMTNGIEVVYGLEESDRETVYFQQAIISVTTVITTGV